MDRDIKIIFAYDMIGDEGKICMNQWDTQYNGVYYMYITTSPLPPLTLCVHFIMPPSRQLQYVA